MESRKVLFWGFSDLDLIQSCLPSLRKNASEVVVQIAPRQQSLGLLPHLPDEVLRAEAADFDYLVSWHMRAENKHSVIVLSLWDLILSVDFPLYQKRFFDLNPIRSKILVVLPRFSWPQEKELYLSPIFLQSQVFFERLKWVHEFFINSHLSSTLLCVPPSWGMFCRLAGFDFFQPRSFALWTFFLKIEGISQISCISLSGISAFLIEKVQEAFQEQGPDSWLGNSFYDMRQFLKPDCSHDFLPVQRRSKYFHIACPITLEKFCRHKLSKPDAYLHLSWLICLASY